MKYYYALFKETPQAIEVNFVDLPGCVTFAKTWDEAIANATDVLGAWLANADPEFIQQPSKHEDLQSTEGVFVPIPVDEKILQSYQELQRFNVIFPANILRKIDTFRKKVGLKRSTFLQKAAEEYLHKHGVNS